MGSVHDHRVIKTEVEDGVARHVYGSTANLSTIDGPHDSPNETLRLIRLDTVWIGLNPEVVTVDVDAIEVQDQVIIRSGPDFEFNARSARDGKAAVFTADVLIDEAVVDPIAGMVSEDGLVGSYGDVSAALNTGHAVVIPVIIAILSNRRGYTERNEQSGSAGEGGQPGRNSFQTLIHFMNLHFLGRHAGFH